MKLNVAEAATLTAEDYKLYAVHAAEIRGIDSDSFVATLQCESGWNPTAVGDKGTSIGIAQIHLPAHQDVTKEQALDGIWSINWAAHEFAVGNQKIWTCFRKLFVS